MRMNSRFIRPVIFLFLIVILVFSGITIFASDFLAVDSSQMVVRQQDPNFVDAYKSQKEFTYTQPLLETNFLKQLIEYLKNRFGSWEEFSAVIPWIFKLLMGGLVILFLFILITKTQLYKLFYSDGEIGNPNFAISTNDDPNIDFDEEIRFQTEQQQYRLAIRLHYLKVIFLLRMKDYIHFSKEKTNVDYWRDLTNADIKSRFFTITSIYNYVWYGDVEIAEEQFLRFQMSFQTFYTAIDV